MLNCDWAQALTRYDCQTLKTLDGSACLEIGTPFSLPGGGAINLYIVPYGESMVKISDNADTMIQLSGMGIDVWQSARMKALRNIIQAQRMDLHKNGEIRMLARTEKAALAFAQTITGLLAVSSWASLQLEELPEEVDIIAELQPHIMARNPNAPFKWHPRVLGASRTEYRFDMQHGSDLIDVIKPNANATGASMRKVSDVLNGPFADNLSPLIIVYDLINSERAATELDILASVTRAMPASRLMKAIH